MPYDKIRSFFKNPWVRLGIVVVAIVEIILCELPDFMNVYAKRNRPFGRTAVGGYLMLFMIYILALLSWGARKFRAYLRERRTKTNSERTSGA
jgi:hypothetical protein